MVRVSHPFPGDAAPGLFLIPMLTSIGLIIACLVAVAWIMDGIVLDFDSRFYHWHIRFWNQWRIEAKKL